MKKILLLLIGFWLLSCSSTHKIPNAEQEIITFQKELNASYLNPEETPLRGNYLSNFKGHPFFPINLKYRIMADFVIISDAEPFDMPTSSGRTQKYLPFAKATFILDGLQHSLIIYQNQRLKDDPKYKDHLFLPFYDETNNIETYGGGRYLDLEIPEGDKILIDFNQAYQPYCAYNLYDYSCPIVPSRNRLNIRIPAGVQYNAAEFEH